MNAPRPRPVEPPPYFSEPQLGPGWVYKSVHWPAEPYSGRIYKGYFARHFAVCVAVVAAVLVLRVGSGVGGLLWVGGSGLFLAIAFAWLTARIAMSHRIGAVRFQGNALFVYSLEDLDAEQPAVNPFPVSYTSPASSTLGLQLHFHDRVITLKANEWKMLREIALHLDELREA